MKTLSDLVTLCYHREDGIFCWGGYLHYSAKPHNPVIIDNQKVLCPVCKGSGQIVTEAGENLLSFIEMYARPLVRKIVEEVLQGRG
jgi:hypothetical protein